jgi:hypothetical protein
MNAFIGVLVNRLQALGHLQGNAVDRSRVAEEAAEWRGFHSRRSPPFARRRQ